MKIEDLENGRYLVLILAAILLFVFVLEARVTLNSPIAFGDEGFHTRMSQYIAENKEYPIYTPIEGIKSQKADFSRPPLWEFLEGSFYLIFGFSEIFVKILTPFIGSILIGLATYLLVKNIYGRRVGFLASLITVTFPAALTYAVLFYVDSLFTFYFTLFVFTLILGIKNDDKKYLLLAGMFAAFTFMTKLVGVFVFFILGLVFIYGISQFLSNRKVFKTYAIPLGVALAFVLAFLVRNTAYYNTPLCTSLLPLDISKCSIDNYTSKYAFQQQIENAQTNLSVLTFGMTNFVDFAYGNVWFIAISVGAGLLYLWKRDSSNILIGIVILSFMVLLTRLLGSRTEDVARFGLAWSPIIATVAALYLSDIQSFISKYQKYLGLIVIIIVIFFGYSNVTSKLATMLSVKQFSPMFFEACDWVKQNLSKDAVLSTVWGHHTTYNCQRVAASNLADFELSNDPDFITKVAKENGITHIFIQKFSIRPQPLQEGYTVDFVKLLANNTSHFKKVYENGPDTNSCIAALSQGQYCDGNIIYEVL